MLKNWNCPSFKTVIDSSSISSHFIMLAQGPKQLFAGPPPLQPNSLHTHSVLSNHSWNHHKTHSCSEPRKDVPSQAVSVCRSKTCSLCNLVQIQIGLWSINLWSSSSTCTSCLFDVGPSSKGVLAGLQVPKVLQDVTTILFKWQCFHLRVIWLWL